MYAVYKNFVRIWHLEHHYTLENFRNFESSFLDFTKWDLPDSLTKHFNWVELQYGFAVKNYNTMITLLFTEQYESFLKFNHDQLRRKFDAEMSDCSCES